jgi:sirohydrochlorin ferrochelatase
MTQDMTQDMMQQPGPRQDRHRSPLGVIVIDHGSSSALSNELLVEVARRVADLEGLDIVEPAHMDLAAPTLDQAFDRCVARGAATVVIVPFFLLPGRHWRQDIPAQASAAAARHPEVRWIVSAPLGLHPLMARIVEDRVRTCLACADGEGEPCETCEQIGGCRTG